MAENYLSSVRRELKNRLSRERIILDKGKFVPQCAYCGKGIHNGIDMHEAIITRGDISGVQKLARKIMVRENCVLVHHDRCHREAATKAGQRCCNQHLVSYEGVSAILEWLETLGEEMKSEQISTAIKEITSYG